jgi:hypothetical protein
LLNVLKDGPLSRKRLLVAMRLPVGILASGVVGHFL